jgi:hypothetical protein
VTPGRGSEPDDFVTREQAVAAYTEHPRFIIDAIDRLATVPTDTLPPGLVSAVGRWYMETGLFETTIEDIIAGVWSP